MAERYNKLYTLPAELYSAGSPVLIAAGALLKDSQTGRMLCQLKFRNISIQNISALKVMVIGHDVSGEEVCRVEHQYLDLNIKRGDSFGSKEAIPLRVSSVRSYDAAVLSVHFADGSRWSAEDDVWEPLPPSQPLREKILDRELLRQYRLESSDKSEYIPYAHKDIWRCACGEISPCGESCLKCGCELSSLEELLNLELLLERKNARLLDESKAAAKRESSRRHSFKIIKTVLLVMLPILIAAGTAFFLYSRSQQKAADYELANLLLSSGQYAEAAEAFDALGDYEQSEAKANQARNVLAEMSSYDKAKKFLENGRYDDAYEAFSAMGDYEDAPELANEAHYLKAIALAENGECEEAMELFASLDDYSDSKARLDCFRMLLVKEEHSYNAECEGPLTVSYTHDDLGRVATKTEHFSAYDGLDDRCFEYSWNGDGSYTETVFKTVREYDTWGILLQENGEVQYTYDYGYYDDGGLKYYGAYDADGVFVFEQVYDEQGNPIRYTTAAGESFTTANEYDEKGLLIKQENFDAENKLVDRTGFEYDEEGRLKRSTYMDLNNTTSVTNFSYELKYLPGLASK